MTDDRRTVLNALVEQTNDAQGEWTSRRALRLVTVAHGRITPTGFETPVGILTEEGTVEANGDQLRPTSEVERICHSGEKQ